VYHLSKWITTIAKIFHLDYMMIGVFDDSQLIGGCVFYIKDFFHIFKKGTTDVPFTKYGGFVFAYPTSTKLRTCEMREHEIMSLILEKIQTSDLINVNLVNGPCITDIRPFTWTGWRERVYYTYVKSLDDDILPTLSYGARRSIRTAQNNGITIKKEYDPDTYWKLTGATYSRQNLENPFQKEDLFSVMEMLIDNNLGEMWIARMPSEVPAAAVFTLYDSHMAHGSSGANDPEFRQTGAASLLLFAMWEDLQKRGFKKYNLMAGNTPHLAKFYAGFNPRRIPYYGVERSKGIGFIYDLYKLVKEYRNS
jgi:hypothetical protein